MAAASGNTTRHIVAVLHMETGAQQIDSAARRAVTHWVTGNALRKEISAGKEATLAARIVVAWEIAVALAIAAG